jgi:MFS family permease
MLGRVRAYREVLSSPAVRNVLLLGALIRIPFFAGAVLLALHVVQTLHGSYAQAGVLSAIVTMCVAMSGPWRGRFLDRLGLRRTILPSILVGAVCWSIAPFVDYVPLLVLAAVAGLFDIPIFTVVRQAVIAASTEQNRQPALALESCRWRRRSWSGRCSALLPPLSGRRRLPCSVCRCSWCLRVFSCGC